MRAYRNVILAFLTVLCAVSCSFLHDDKLVAKVGSKKLYRSEVVNHIPKGLCREDSLAMARQYIDTWAGELIMNDMASVQLSPKEKDVSKEIEDYRSSLLKYRYEQHYIEERLDTTVTEDQIASMYRNNPSLFQLYVPILKCRYLSFHDNPKLHDSLLKLLCSDDEGDMALLESMAGKTVHKFTSFDGQWIDVVTLARYYGIDYGTLLVSMNKSIIDIVDNQGENHIAFVTDYMQAGKIPPLEYCRDKIRDVIISQRKYALMTTLEQDLLDNARKNGNFVIYETDEN